MAQANAKDMISILSEEEFDLVNVRQSPTITSPLTIIMESLPKKVYSHSGAYCGCGIYSVRDGKKPAEGCRADGFFPFSLAGRILPPSR